MEGRALKHTNITQKGYRKMFYGRKTLVFYSRKVWQKSRKVQNHISLNVMLENSPIYSYIRLPNEQ